MALPRARSKSERLDSDAEAERAIPARPVIRPVASSHTAIVFVESAEKYASIPVQSQRARIERLSRQHSLSGEQEEPRLRIGGRASYRSHPRP